MKIRDFIQRGRQLYVQCPGPHLGMGIISTRRVPLDLSQFDPDMDHNDLHGKLRCSVCGRKDARMLLIPQTDRQMRQGRQR